MTFFENLIGVRKTTPQQQRRGKLLARLILITVFLDLLLAAANVWSWMHFGSTADRGYFYLGMAGLLVLFGLWVLNRLGRTYLSAVLLLVAYIIRISIVQDPVRFSNSFWGFSFPIVMSSFILGPAISFPAAVISAVTYLLTSAYIGSSESMESMIVKIISLFTMAIISYLTASHLDRAIETVDKSEAKYHNLFNHMPIGLYRTSPSGQILDFNAAFLKMFGFPDSQSLLNVKAAELYADPSSRSKYLSVVEKNHPIEMQMRRLDGTAFWVSDHVTPVYDDQGKIKCYEGSLIDITERKRAVQELEYLATTDPLTGLSNRRHFFSQAEQVLAQADRPSCELAILMIDIDHFKLVNDQHGHLTGDAVLQEVTQRIRESLRSDDLSGRYGGEEFSVLLSCVHKREIRLIANRLIEMVAGKPIRINDVEVSITISMGVAVLDSPASTLDVLVQRADQALYAAKHAGRNRWIEWDRSLAAD